MQQKAEHLHRVGLVLSTSEDVLEAVFFKRAAPTCSFVPPLGLDEGCTLHTWQY